MQTRSPQASLLLSSGPHTGSSVTNNGLAFFSFCSLSQFVTAAFQSQVCFSRSKASPGGHLICCRPYLQGIGLDHFSQLYLKNLTEAVHWTTSLQLFFPAWSLNISPELFPSQSFAASSFWARTPGKFVNIEPDDFLWGGGGMVTSDHELSDVGRPVSQSWPGQVWG